ncbi:hypothetical protein CISIN_1g041059mg [Citrus sinensis]|uniref:HAT C-terminal dimerisation domain-containing protein n=1 Tax=Citrus sinensis TaxID=2711 RepID=A0A067EYU0_CITSI|nr:hypothetical protein CISIN_1g041059mg [Citrus sinensis]
MNERLTLSYASNLADSFKSFNVDDIYNLCIYLLSELCQQLVEIIKFQIYFLINILIRLVLTLPILTVMTEQEFSAMKLIKTPLRKKDENEFLLDCMVIYIKREFVDNNDLDLIIDEFNSRKNLKAQLK